MAGLLALVAHALLGRLCGAVARKMTNLATARVTLSATFFHQVSGQNNSLVALLALGAVAAHVAETAAGVAGLLALLTVATGTGTATVSTLLLLLLLATEATTVATGTTLAAVAGNVSDLATLVALLATTGLAAEATGTGTATNGLGALAGDVTDFTACEKVWSAKITRL